MALLNKLKSLFGLDDGESGSDRQRTDDVGVTVEHEPETTEESADEDAPPATPAPGSGAAEPEPAEGNESDSTDDPDVEPVVDSPPADTESESPEELNGRGSTADSEPESASGPVVDSGETAGNSEDDTEFESAMESEPTEESEPEPVDGEAEFNEASEDDGSGPAADSAGDDAGEDPLREIKGIGPSYATKLSAAGVDSAGDLAAADASELSESTDLSEKRIQGWIDRAKSH